MASETLLWISALILILPLLGFVFLVFFGKRIGRPSAYIGTSVLGIDLLLSIWVCYSKLVTHESTALIQAKLTWFSIGDFAVRVGIGIDNLAAMMLIVVTLISFLVHLFSIEYMLDDKRYSRYYSYLGLFSFSMLGIVIANNFLFMYIFWELVGISSYLLIGFWYEKKSAADAGKKAFIVNRIGDLGFLIGILILFSTYNTFMFDEIFYGDKVQQFLGNVTTYGNNAFSVMGIANGHMPQIPFIGGVFLTFTGIMIFCGAIGKSAQFPLHVWLPDAMEGPTPVSALIHAATMVAAGVYLVARVFPMFSAGALTFIAYIGAITAFMAATIAITQVDFKKVLAYSTVSQLGYMIMSLGVCSYTTGFFHLVTHAWFKAALFLASGSVIHAMHHSMHKLHDHHTDPQDIRNMGGLRKTMPLTYITFLMVTLAISGVPFTSGFLSKDGILAGTLAYAQLTGGINWIIPLMGFGAAGITAFYMFRLTIVAFHGKPTTEVASKTHENKFVIVFPLVLLAILSFWFFYSPNPFNASQGWFHKSLPAPITAVPANYQHGFLMPYQMPGAEHETSASEGTAVEVNEQGQAVTHNETAISANKTTEHAATGHSAHHGKNKYEEQLHAAHIPAMIISLLIAGLGILFSFMVYQFKIFSADNMEKQFKPLHTFSFRKWYFDEIYHATAVAGTVGLSKVLGLFDNKIIDGLVNLSALISRGFSYFIGHFDNIVIDGLVNLTANVTGFFGALFRKVQTGSVQTYVIFVIIGVIALIYIFL
ncbi:MAG: NADH-quinone oxidoreductase subunit [Bacteroidota bacterium]|nr:NADH-quinone oxidoreductase subunit [Bacteroidota bacterium]